MSNHPGIRWFADIGTADVAQVGGKNASLGEMVRALAPYGLRVPNGFAITADAYRDVLRQARAIVYAAALPPDLASAILAAHARRAPSTATASR